MIADITESQLLDTSVLDNDPATTDLLMQLFLSDVTPEEELIKLSCVSAPLPTHPTSLDVDRDMGVVSTASTPTSSLATVPQLPSPEPFVQSDSSASSKAPSPSPVLDLQSRGNTTGDDVISAFMFSASPLECTDTNDFNDPLDNPFLTESMDLTDFLQGPSSVSTMFSSPPSNSNNTASSSVTVLPEFCSPSSPVGSSTDAHVSNTHSQGELNLFDLSQTVSLLTQSFDAPEVENLDIDFSTFSSDTISLVPGCPDELTTQQLSVMLTQTRTSTSSSVGVDDLAPSSVASTDDVFIESSPSPPSSVVESSAKARKRTASDLESDVESCEQPTSKKTKLNRRQKNNIASQASRAKRRAKNVAMSSRVGELESENALLRIKEKELTAEIEKFKKLLVDRLSQ